MNCLELQTHAPPYVDGELGVDVTLAVRAHLAQCPSCRRLVEREHQFRQLLRRQPRESAPPEVRATVLAACRREGRRGLVLSRLVAPGLAAAAAVLVTAVVLGGAPEPAPLMRALVATHIAYTDIERPAEFASRDRGEIEAWFQERAGLRPTVPDYSTAGIRLVGARLATVDERRAAFVLYEKGHTLLSVFMIPVSAPETALTGETVTYRGRPYLTQERKGHRTVAWSDGHAVFGLVSMLDYPSLLECADRLRDERAARARL